MQALEKTVTSRERGITAAARALQATAQTMLHKTKPLTQVGFCPLRQAPGGGQGCPRGDLGAELQGREGKGQSSSFHASSASPRAPENLTVSQGRRQAGQTAGSTSSTQGLAHRLYSASFQLGWVFIHSFGRSSPARCAQSTSSATGLTHTVWHGSQTWSRC